MEEQARSMVVGVFTERERGEEAIQALSREGFYSKQIDALIGLGMPKEEAYFYQNELSRGRTIIVVDATHREREARHILERYGAYDIATRGLQTDGAPPEEKETNIHTDNYNPNLPRETEH